MTALARVPTSLGAFVASAAMVAGCQSILGIDTDRPLDAGAPGDDGGHPQDAASGDGTTADASPVSDGGGGTSDAGSDSGSGYTFLNPLQIDASSIFNANSVATTAVGGASLTPMDGPGTSDDNDFPTQSAVLKLNASGVGLPDDGFFAASGTIPNVHLAFSDQNNVLNSIVISSTSPTNYTLSVPPAHYSHIQMYATGTGGASTVNYTLTYADPSPTQNAMVLPDWCLPPTTLPAGVSVLKGVDRVQNNGTVFNGAYLCNIYALDLSPDPSKTLVSLTFSNTGSGNTSYFIFYGATAW